MWGKGPPPTPLLHSWTPVKGHLKLLGKAQKRGLGCVGRGSAGPCPEQDPSFVQGLPRKVRKDEQCIGNTGGLRSERDGDR